MIKRMTKLISFLSIFIVVFLNQSHSTYSFICKQITGLTNVDLFFDEIIASFVNDVQFYLYTNEMRKAEIDPHGFHMKSLTFNPSRRTTVVIHGYLANHESEWVQKLITKLLKWKDMNVIAVDWWKVFQKKNYNYGKSALRTEYVANKLYKVLSRLAIELNQPLKDWGYLHFMGHSLGAHASGLAAEKLKSERLVDRITAFDPARPYFDTDASHLRLKKTNAKFVDVIHVNSHLTEQTLGLYEPLGHIDFYPNGGDRQIHCILYGRTLHNDEISRCLSYLFFGVDAVGIVSAYLSRRQQSDDMICDHGQGQQYFAQSITNSSKFLAYKVILPIEKKEAECSSQNCTLETCIEMGINADQYSDTKYYGTYYLDVPRCDSD